MQGLISFIIISQLRRAFRQWDSLLLFALWTGMGALSGLGLAVLVQMMPEEQGEVLADQVDVDALMRFPVGLAGFVGFTLLLRGVAMGLQPSPRIVARHHPLSAWKRVLLHLTVDLSSSSVVHPWGLLMGFLLFFPQVGLLQYVGIHVFLLAAIVVNQVLRNSLLRRGLAFGLLPMAVAIGQAVVLLATLFWCWESPAVWVLITTGVLILGYYLLLRDEQQIELLAKPSMAIPQAGTGRMSLFWLKFKAFRREKSGLYCLVAYCIGKLAFSMLSLYPELLSMEEEPAHSYIWYAWALSVFVLFAYRFGVRTEMTLWQLQLKRSNRYWLGQYFDTYFWMATGIDVVLSLILFLFLQAPIPLLFAYLVTWLLWVILGLLSNFFFARKVAVSSGVSLRQKNPIGWRIFAVFMSSMIFLGHVFAASPTVRYGFLGVLVVAATLLVIYLLFDKRLPSRLQQKLEEGTEYEW